MELSSQNYLGTCLENNQNELKLSLLYLGTFVLYEKKRNLPFFVAKLTILRKSNE